MNIHFRTLIFLLSVVSLQVIPHGFVGNTIVALDDDESSMAIDNVVSQFLMGRAHKVATYKEKSRSWKRKVVQAVAHCQAQVHLELTFVSPNRASSDVIECSPIQQFYRLSDSAWVEAHNLCEGDELLCKKYGSVRLESKKIMHDPATLYIIEIKKHHTFLVGQHKIVTHNIFIPIAATIGMSIPFDIVFGAGSLGFLFGPVTFCCSVAVAGVTAALAYQLTKEKHTNFTLAVDGVGTYQFGPTTGCGKDCSDDTSIATGCGLDGMPPYSSGNTGGCGLTIDMRDQEIISCGIDPRLYPAAIATHTFKDSASDQPASSKATVEDILSDAEKQGNTGGPSKIYVKPGTVDDMAKDFEKLDLKDRKKFKDSEGHDAEYGYLDDGRKVSARKTSKDGRPTLEIGVPSRASREKIKIRYDQESDEKTIKGN